MNLKGIPKSAQPAVAKMWQDAEAAQLKQGKDVRLSVHKGEGTIVDATISMACPRPITSSIMSVALSMSASFSKTDCLLSSGSSGTETWTRVFIDPADYLDLANDQFVLGWFNDLPDHTDCDIFTLRERASDGSLSDHFNFAVANAVTGSCDNPDPPKDPPPSFVGGDVGMGAYIYQSGDNFVLEAFASAYGGRCVDNRIGHEGETICGAGLDGIGSVILATSPTLDGLIGTHNFTGAGDLSGPNWISSFTITVVISP